MLSYRGRLAAGAVLFSLVLACVFGFQNCAGGGFEISSGKTSVGSLSNLPTDSQVVDVHPGGPPSGSGNGGDGTPNPSVSFSENPSASLITADSVSGGPSEGALLQRNNQGRAQLQLSFGSLSAKYYSSKLLVDGVVVASSTPKTFTTGTRLIFDVVTGLKPSQLRVSFYNATGAETHRYVTKTFLVGEIFLIAGQSNSAGHGESPQSASQRLNKSFNPETLAWGALQDPLPYATNWSNPAYGSQANPGGSPWPAMADRLSASIGVPVGVASVGWGGSSVKEWITPMNNNPPLVERLVKAATGISGCGFRAVLWHQGETDSVHRMSRTEYKNTLRSLRSIFQSRTSCSVPWLIARASQSLPETKTPLNNLMEIRNAQTDLWQESGFGRGPDTDLMNGRTYRYDLLHFSNYGLGLHGRLWANRIGALFGLTVATDSSMIPEASQVQGVYQVTLGRSVSDMDIDHNGLFYHTNRIQIGEVNLSQLEGEMRSSDEFFIRARYHELIRRSPTIQEVLAWNVRISAGEFPTRESLSAAIAREAR